jgi:diaminohydroxyphosphoribosylaminopyrimidine deaminase / 5-amino-6-(5-phosphoribosylamino)uracil reductase
MSPDPFPFSAIDHALMTRALRLAERGAYTTRPNPMVGCVLAHGARVVGEGWHVRAGEPHAEVLALREAGDRARGATTVYVTLEPCAHVGRTGPCADALVEAGVSRVVAAMHDPFRQVDGAGLERLREAGIEVAIGLMEREARELNRGFVSRIVRGRPWVRVKLASSLDGRSALASGDSKWISCEASRRDVHRWRARAGAILTGAGTVLADDPSLTVRLDDGIAVRSAAAGGARPGPGHGRARQGARGRRADPVPARPGRQAATRPGCRPRARRGGSRPCSTCARCCGCWPSARSTRCRSRPAPPWPARSWPGLVDELLLYVAPVVLGAHARPLFDGLDIAHMAERLELEILETRRLGSDIRILLRPPAGDQA